MKIEDSIHRISEDDLNIAFFPSIKEEQYTKPLLTARTISPGATTGYLCFSYREAETILERGDNAILFVRHLSPSDSPQFCSASGLIAFNVSNSSHDAIIARSRGVPYISIDCTKGSIDSYIRKFRELSDDLVTVDFTKGKLYMGEIEVISPAILTDEHLKSFYSYCDTLRTTKVFANADTINEVIKALEVGADGFEPRSEHMLTETAEIRELQLFLFCEIIGVKYSSNKLKRILTEYFSKYLDCANGKPVLLRLLDAPLPEFLPASDDVVDFINANTGILYDEVKSKLTTLNSHDAMMGLRGVRLCITQPRIARVFIQSMLNAVENLKGNNSYQKNLIINIPLPINIKEVRIIQSIISDVLEDFPTISLDDFGIASMIETPSAALQAGEISRGLSYVSFGSNDLTAYTLAISRNDIYDLFLEEYVTRGILDTDPFVTLDTTVKNLIGIALDGIANASPSTKATICGEHSSEPEVIEFAIKSGMQVVSCNLPRIRHAKFYCLKAETELRGQKSL